MMNDKITIRSIAGYCHELALWRMIANLSFALLSDEEKVWHVLTPDTVIVDGEDFYIDYVQSQKDAEEFYPPEGVKDMGEAGIVWTLGALVCYASSGHYIFGGQGGAYQRNRPKVELPVLRKEHSALTGLVQRCLCFSPSQRITLKPLHDQATKGLESCEKRIRTLSSGQSRDVIETSSMLDDIWPEKMS